MCIVSSFDKREETNCCLFKTETFFQAWLFYSFCSQQFGEVVLFHNVPVFMKWVTLINHSWVTLAPGLTYYTGMHIWFDIVFIVFNKWGSFWKCRSGEPGGCSWTCFANVLGFQQCIKVSFTLMQWPSAMKWPIKISAGVSMLWLTGVIWSMFGNAGTYLSVCLFVGGTAIYFTGKLM